MGGKNQKKIENVSMVKNALQETIKEICRDREKYGLVPNAFIRNRALPLDRLITDILLLENKSIEKSLLSNHQYSTDTPTTEAFIRQRNKLSPDAFKDMFISFNKKTSEFCKKTYKGYKLFACDGTDVSIYLNPKDEETYIHQAGMKGFNQLHVNTLYDLLNQVYTDVTISGKKKNSERKELNAMADGFDLENPSIIIADRGYEGINVYAHLIEKGFKFLIRLKDVDSNGIASNYKDMGETFDIDFDKILARCVPQHCENREKIKILSEQSPFDFFENEDDIYPINFRVVRFQLDNGNYECVATNLNREEFPPEELKQLYAKRWGIELSYRDLKYTLGLNNLHARKTNSVKQEIYANLIMYNFCRINSSFAEVEKKIYR